MSYISGKSIGEWKTPALIEAGTTADCEFNISENFGTTQYKVYERNGLNLAGNTTEIFPFWNNTANTSTLDFMQSETNASGINFSIDIIKITADQPIEVLLNPHYNFGMVYSMTDTEILFGLPIIFDFSGGAPVQIPPIPVLLVNNINSNQITYNVEVLRLSEVVYDIIACDGSITKGVAESNYYNNSGVSEYQGDINLEYYLRGNEYVFNRASESYGIDIRIPDGLYADEIIQCSKVKIYKTLDYPRTYFQTETNTKIYLNAPESGEMLSYETTEYINGNDIVLDEDSFTKNSITYNNQNINTITTGEFFYIPGQNNEGLNLINVELTYEKEVDCDCGCPDICGGGITIKFTQFCGDVLDVIIDGWVQSGQYVMEGDPFSASNGKEIIPVLNKYAVYDLVIEQTTDSGWLYIHDLISENEKITIGGIDYVFIKETIESQWDSFSIYGQSILKIKRVDTIKVIRRKCCN